QGATMFMTLLAAFMILLHRYTGRQDLPVGTPIANRDQPETEGLIGFFLNTLVMRVDLSGGPAHREPSFEELLGRVREVALEAYAHQQLPFEMLVEELDPERSRSRQPLFQVMFAMVTASRETVNFPELTLRQLDTATESAKFDLTLFMQQAPDGLTGLFEYSTDLFDATTIARMTGQLGVLLESIAARPQGRISTLELLAAAERHELLAEWNDTPAPYPQEACIHELFEAQAARTPESVAVVRGRERLSYRELDLRSNRLGNHLRELGVGPDVAVGIALPRSMDLVEALLAVLKAGGVFVPLDSSYPEERLAFMLQNAEVDVLVARRELLDPLARPDARIVVPDADREAIRRHGVDRPASGVRPDNLAYLIYTSGSTGRPKGVSMPHRALTNLIHWQRLRAGFAGGARTLQFPSMSFDVFLQEIFSTFASGGTLFLISEEVRRDPSRIAEVLDRERVERLHLPFVALQQLAEAAADRPPSGLREVITAGEQLQVSRGVERFFTHLDAHGGCTLENQYGPAETHVVSAHTLAGAAAGWPALPPIGRPVANFRIYLLDPRRRPVPAGVPGEVFLGGAGLARGYYHRPDLTAERFLPDPLSGDPRGEEPGTRMYATGDLARLRSDGNLEFLGRIDHQVKIRGYRIELGEIEAALERSSLVRECAVVAREAGDEKRLVAYFAADDGAPATGELRRHLLETLPEYMVPSVYVELEALPLTPSGKVDRRSLPAPEPTALSESWVGPRGPVEELVAGIWSDVLGTAGRVGAHDDFFALGGHSLLATRVQSHLRRELGVEVALRTLFERPTLAGFAEHVAAALGREEGPEAPPIRPVARRD
ncbi:MAG: amino acid adenylation domain-containing protein, partial [bacterium]|nr:amino acid adenylation domain-containing protein [bacterium]